MATYPPAKGIKQTSRIAIVTVLLLLFALPLVAYLFFLNGEHHFKTLPIVTQQVGNLSEFQSLDGSELQLKDSVTVLNFLGHRPYDRLGYISNINDKVYKDFHEFNNFQMISIVSEQGLKDVQEVVLQMKENTDMSDWHFVTASDQQISEFFEALQTDLELNKDFSSDYVFIIDKNASLRGRTDDPDQGMVYGYDSSLVAHLNKRMVDDMRVLLAEYRFAFKKNRDQKLQKDGS
ncbi:membrane or secreted protein [Nonlabens xiamenensis]|uniref:membrane or secreted protein n=1 Tax=Nonlabens xiamenensis TaxID=2341043 RepID=UPI000F60A6F2|nr:membrane or secreted protein [Nonlabens xiamenensis]